MIRKARTWLLWSHANFWTGVAGLVLGLVVLAVAWTMILPDHHSAKAGPKKPTIAGYVWTEPTATPVPTPTTEPERMVYAAADNFVRTWLNKTPGWWSRVRPLITLDLRASMKTTNVDAIPVTTIKTVEVTNRTKFYSTADVTLTNGTVLTVAMSSDGVHGWRVVSLTPKDTVPPSET